MAQFYLMDDSMLRSVVLKIRHHNTMAHNASERWLRRKAWLKAYIKHNAHSYQTEKSKRDKYADDWELEDQMSDWNWHRREAMRLEMMVQTEAAFRSLLSRNEVRIDPGHIDKLKGAINGS